MTSLLGSLDRRFWLAGAAGTVLGLLGLGVPTAIIPNPFFSRMTPTGTLDILFWVLSAPLIGLIVATFVAKPPAPTPGGDTSAGATTSSVAGIGTFLAIGCPICNKIVVGLLGLSGALTIFAPLQPIIGAGSLMLLAASLAVRLRSRARVCIDCLRPDQARM